MMEWAVREYAAERIDDQTIRELIDAAIQAPSAVHEQPWAFSLVRDRSLLARISAEAKAFTLKTPPTQIPSHHLQGMLQNPEFDIFYHAPALIVISSIMENQWAMENYSLAAENFDAGRPRSGSWKLLDWIYPRHDWVHRKATGRFKFPWNMFPWVPSS